MIVCLQDSGLRDMLNAPSNTVDAETDETMMLGNVNHNFAHASPHHYGNSYVPSRLL